MLLLFSFSQRIFSHMLLGDKTYWYLRGTKKVARVQEKGGTGYCISRGVSFGGPEIPGDLGQEKGLGAAPSSQSLGIRGETGFGCCGENSPPL